jgi:hypothetical protein
MLKVDSAFIGVQSIKSIVPWYEKLFGQVYNQMDSMAEWKIGGGWLEIVVHTKRSRVTLFETDMNERRALLKKAGIEFVEEKSGIMVTDPDGNQIVFVLAT